VGLSWDADARGAHFLDVADEHGAVHAVRIDGRPVAIARGLDESLRRLGIEQVDLVQVHHRDHDVPVAETMGALAELVRAGKARHVGVSNYSAEELREAQAALGELPLASDQLELSVLARDAAAPVIAQARALDVGLLAYSPLGAGLIGGGRPPLVDRVLDRAMAEPARRDLDRRLEAAVRPIAQQVQATIAEVLLAWTIAEPGVTAAIIGARTLEQARQAARAGTLQLPATASARLASAFAGWTPPPDPWAAPRARVRSIAEKVARKVSAKLAR
jgi:aryl-alcohol dehydrogenase-like predicted oxidoreductase